jgi:two-component system sensor histidine kinase YesM
MKRTKSVRKYKRRFLVFINKLKLKNISIFSKLLSIIVLFLFLMALLSYVTFINFQKDKELSAITFVKQTNSQAKEKINDYINDMKNVTKFPLAAKEEDISYVTEMESFSNTGIPSINLQKMNEQMFYEIFGYKEHIHSAFVFNLHGQADYKIKGSLYKGFNPTGEPWFKASIANFGKPVIIDTFELPFIWENTKNSKYVFSMARGIVRMQSSKVVGVMLVNTSIDFLANICNDMFFSPNQRIIIVSESGKTIYDTIESNIAKPLDNELLKINWNAENTEHISIEGESILASSDIISTSGWRIINLIPTNELYQSVNTMKNFTIFLTAILISLATIIVYLISRQIVNPMRKLVSLMNIIEKGDFDVKINLTRKDEVGTLAKSFNSMARKVKSLIKEVYLDKIKQTELELQMHQNQINPHFLYNTLESISMMATINDDDEASDMASALGSILRYGLDKTNAKVTVRQELSHLENYTMLQHVRFRNAYQIVIDIAPDILDCLITKLVLQPAVENAIYHGMKNIRSGGLIKVLGYVENNLIVFDIIDNGKGMDKQQVKLLNGYINDLNESFKSIGLRNVNKRIKLMYGENYGVTIFSKFEQGTTVKIVFPFPQ